MEAINHGSRSGLFLRKNGGKREVRVSAEDRGIGIGSGELKHIFEAFYRSPEEVSGSFQHSATLPINPCRASPNHSASPSTPAAPSPTAFGQIPPAACGC